MGEQVTEVVEPETLDNPNCACTLHAGTAKRFLLPTCQQRCPTHPHPLAAPHCATHSTVPTLNLTPQRYTYTSVCCSTRPAVHVQQYTRQYTHTYLRSARLPGCVRKACERWSPGGPLPGRCPALRL